MTTQDTSTENKSQETENISAIYLRVDQEDDGVAIKCNYHKASTTLLLQSIAYMLDTAYKGDRDQATKVAEVLPDVVKEYFNLKEAQNDVTEAQETLDNAIASMDTEVLKLAIKEELDRKDGNIDYVMKLSSELMRREVKGDREGTKEKTTDSL